MTTDIKWFRRFLALHQLVYLTSFWPYPAKWFASGQMVIPQLTYPQVPSLLHLFDSPLFANGIWFVAVLGWIALACGKLPKWGQVILFVIQVSLHNANPLIIHEPQQLANFFLFVSILWPSQTEVRAGVYMNRLMLVFLCSYYVVAGLKKLPDPHWLAGDALSMLLGWQPLAKDNFITRELLAAPFLAKIMTWATLTFELGFSLVAWSRWRLYLIPAGIIFHLLIGLTLEVGTFGWIMAPWYVFLIKRK